jgi:hypothetical protein
MPARFIAENPWRNRDSRSDEDLLRDIEAWFVGRCAEIAD